MMWTASARCNLVFYFSSLDMYYICYVYDMHIVFLARRWNAVLQRLLVWALFVLLLLSTLVCCQPTELILGFFVS